MFFFNTHQQGNRMHNASVVSQNTGFFLRPVLLGESVF